MYVCALCVVREHVGGQFTKKRDAHMRLAKIVEYVIIDSTRQYARCMTIAFADINAGTGVPFVVHLVHGDN